MTLASIGKEAEAAPIFKAVFAKEPIWAELLERLPAAGLFPDDKPLIDADQEAEAIAAQARSAAADRRTRFLSMLIACARAPLRWR